MQIRRVPDYAPALRGRLIGEARRRYHSGLPSLDIVFANFGHRPVVLEAGVFYCNERTNQKIWVFASKRQSAFWVAFEEGDAFYLLSKSNDSDGAYPDFLRRCLSEERLEPESFLLRMIHHATIGEIEPNRYRKKAA